MGDKSTYLQNAVLDAVLNNVSYTSPANVYVGLWIGDPKTTGNEVATTGSTNYVRQTVSFAPPVNGITTSSADVTFGIASASYGGTVTHFALHDNVSAGNILYSDALASSQTIDVGNQPKFVAGSISVQES